MENPLTTLPDDELVHLTISRKGRDQRPFWELYQRHRETVWRVCYRFLNSSQDAEDITQEVFFRAYRSLEQFRGQASFKTWIYRIAINTSQNELRRLSRRPQINETSVDDLAEILPSGESPESAWLEKERQRTLQQALENLRAEEIEILMLKDMEEKPYVEISGILGISVSAAKMRVQRARLSLQHAYRKLYGETSH